MSDYVAWFDSPAATVDRVGGKAASLARLANAGFPVPPGFAVTVEGYRAFHAAAELDRALPPVLALSGRPPFSEVKAACAGLSQRIEAAPLPAAVAEEVAAAHAELERRAAAGAGFAVRSSAISEDSAGASFAGLYESYLGLSGAPAVVEAVGRCYRCLWEPRAVHYRTVKGMPHDREAMGVAVMETVASAVSGVAFTLNPVSGAKDEILINASWGLGEAIVSGLVTPDSITATRTGDVKEYTAGDKNLRVVPDGGTTKKEKVPGRQAKKPALSGAQVADITRTALGVEELYGCPIDIEFAFDAAGRFFLLQARPVTTR